MDDAHLLYETCWAPEVLDAVDERRLQRFLLYKRVRSVREYGGELKFPEAANGE